MRSARRRRNRSRQSAFCTNSACRQPGFGAAERRCWHRVLVRFGSIRGCYIGRACRNGVGPSRSLDNALSDRRHGVLPGRSRFSGRRSVGVGSWRRYSRGHDGAFGLRRSIQMGTHMAQKHSGWQIARWRMSGGTTKAVRRGAKTSAITAVPWDVGICSYHAAAELTHAAERPQCSLRTSVGAVAGAR